METPDRRQYLERLIQGLEQTIENMKFEIPYYAPDDVQLIYAKKFLTAAEENMAKARKELETLPKAAPKGPAKPPKGL